MYAEFRKDKDADKESINDDIVFEIELIKQVEINVDYILMLVQKYREQHGDGEDKEIRAEISRAVDASPSLRNKRDLIEDFVDRISIDGSVDDQWQAYIAQRREAELQTIIDDEHLRPAETRRFVERAFTHGAIQTGGTAVTTILPPMSRFAPPAGTARRSSGSSTGSLRSSSASSAWARAATRSRSPASSQPASRRR
ncbi:type I restriction endonuclease subunit R, EcoR124 family [Tessaracoccus coleopterorum]|uniref:type I restriction endonuclease subunit R, EcoR124 family n=1 Tax=Tessaracoccus coleopterorum TaxID=2714950 RepID=UPI0022B22BB3|nr:hypothetical protein [Tessaracoccus coleopterorum]